MFKNKNFRRWFFQSTLGILLLGSGLCLMMESAFYKHSNPPFWNWVFAGTGSLIVVMTGIILMVDGIRYRMKYEAEQKK